MSIFDTIDPFSDLSPFGDEARSNQNEMVNELRYWRELRESVEAKLLEVLDVAVPPPPVSTRVHLARITGINHDVPLPNSPPTYKAISIDTANAVGGGRFTVPEGSSAYDNQSPSIASAWVSPITRPVSIPPMSVDDASLAGGPASLGDLCFIVVDRDDADPPNEPRGLFLWETARTLPCPASPNPSPVGSQLPGGLADQIESVLDEQARSWP